MATSCPRAGRSHEPSEHHMQICHCRHNRLTFLLLVRSLLLFPRLFFLGTKTRRQGPGGACTSTCERATYLPIVITCAVCLDSSCKVYACLCSSSAEKGAEELLHRMKEGRERKERKEWQKKNRRRVSASAKPFAVPHYVPKCA